MATTITELNTTPGAHRDTWMLNVTVTDASGGVNLREAAEDYQHGIRNIVITPNEDEWVEILDGTDPLIGPLNLEKGVPWSSEFDDGIYCSRGNALVLKSESEFNIHLLIEGDTGIPISSPSASPSASPSEGS